MLHFVMRGASQLESLGEEDGISADMHTITITGVATPWPRAIGHTRRRLDTLQSLFRLIAVVFSCFLWE